MRFKLSQNSDLFYCLNVHIHNFCHDVYNFAVIPLAKSFDEHPQITMNVYIFDIYGLLKQVLSLI